MVKLIGRVAPLLLIFAAFTQVTTSQTRSADETLKDRVEYRLETHAAVRKYDIKVNAAAGKVTLTGEVATAAQKAEAGKVAKISGVTSVDNQIKVDPNTDKTLAERTKTGLNKMGEKITDAWITTKVKWFLTGEDLLKGSNINVDTTNRVVTLKGTVKTQAGRTRAMALAKDTDGVTRVVDQLTIG
jgi:hyperosmotically inducible periplasmic protein